MRERVLSMWWDSHWYLLVPVFRLDSESGHPLCGGQLAGSRTKNTIGNAVFVKREASLASAEYQLLEMPLRLCLTWARL